MWVHCHLHLTLFQPPTSENVLVENVADVIVVNSHIKICSLARIKNTWFAFFLLKIFFYLFISLSNT